MKLSLNAILMAATVVARPSPQGHDHKAAPADKPGFLEGGAPPAPLALFKMTNEEAPSSIRPGAQRSQMYFGPLTLKTVAERKAETNAPVGMDPQGNVFNMYLTGFIGNVTLLNSKMSIRNAQGDHLGIAQGVYNHHISVTDSNAKMSPILSCPNEKRMADMALNSLAGVGEDGGSKSFDTEDDTRTKGFYVGEGDKILFGAEIINNANVTQNVYAVIDIEYTKGKPESPTSWHVLNVAMCDGKGIEIKPTEKGLRRYTVSSQPMTVKKTGSIFGIRGHLHDGGVDVVLKNNDKVVCESKATYGGKNGKSGDWETITLMGSCGEKTGIPVKKGDVLTLSTSYDFDVHPARKNGNGMAAEVMGMALFSFAET